MIGRTMFVAAWVSAVCLSTRPLLAGEITEFWFYKSVNLLVDKNVDETAALIKRAGQAGYTHCLLTDSKFSRLHEMPERYFRNVEKVKSSAKEAGVELVPALFSFGYSNDLLGRDPNLIEGLPVKDAPLVIEKGVARSTAAPPTLKNLNFNSPKPWDWKDETVSIVDGSAVFTEPRDKPTRISQKISLTPFRQYHISARFRCEDFKGTPEIKVIAGDHVLNYDYLKTQPTQDWTTHHVVFNSLEHTQGNLYIGAWDGRGGRFWCDDVVVEEVPFLNLVRRDGAPLVVKTADGQVLKEGTDYEPLVDPLMGTQPYTGCYTVYHEPPVLRSKLPEGTNLLASYHHAATVHDDQANICPSEPATVELLRDQAARVHKLFGAKGYMMSHDEIRVYNQCDACRARNLDAGPLLADNVRTCIKALRDVNPNVRIYVWSDMFDPFHNAHKDFYLSRGDFAGSWEGLDSGVTIVPWYFENRGQSLKFFADRGHKQVIAGYYDGPVEQIRDWIAAGQPIAGVESVMYTTWANDYSKLEDFIREAKAALKK